MTILITQAGRQIQPSSRLRKLTPFLDADGVLRVEGRLEMAVMLSANQQHPIVLPPEGHLPRLVIIDAHCSMLHASADRTHFELRSTFWILRGIQTVGRVLRGCQECKRRKSKPMQPRMAPLPPARVTAYTPVFHSTGIDYLGPLYVTVKRSTEKRWVCLFTCLSTRAIHLELATDLSAPSLHPAAQQHFMLVERERAPRTFIAPDRWNKRVARIFLLVLQACNLQQQ